MGERYNGWNSLIRNGRDKHYYHARRRGILPQAVICAICEHDYQEPCIGYHSEEYGPTIEDYFSHCVPLCNHCHAMLHIRHAAPNRWNDYLTRLADGEQFTSSPHYVSQLSHCRKLPEIASTPIPSTLSRYAEALMDPPYQGEDKVATLLVQPLDSQDVVELPDWTLYGNTLERLTQSGRDRLESRGVDLSRFLAGRVSLPLKSDGSFIYQRLYLDRVFD